MRTWMIGSGEDCDVVVAQPRVSRRHCRLIEAADGYLLEDQGSSNGTYVNGVRIAEPTRVSSGDRITLGMLEPMPWPPASGVPGATLLRIGRVADNEVVLDDPRVSSHHARLIVSGTRMLIEDAGSSNGTFVNSPEQRVTQPTPLTESDTVYFGSLAVPATRLLPARAVPQAVVPAPPPLPEPKVLPEPAAAPPPVVPATTVPATVAPWMIVLLAQAPVLAILVLLAFGRQAAGPITPTNRSMVAEGIASTTFGLAMSALWLGGSLAAWASMAGGSLSGRSDSLEAGILAAPDRKFAAIGALCVIQCAVLLAIVYWGSGLKGPWLSMFGVLLLTASVGLSLGLVVFLLLRAQRSAAVAVSMVAFAAMLLLGGRIGALAASRPGAWVAAAMPSRWAFEGLLLLENEGRAAPTSPDEAGSDRADDLAEGFFPAGSARMGPKADAMALGLMLIGLAAAAGFISSGSQPRR
jgi:pSer/pThr/pTyr-binding forkhead associated (FHA) protein